MEPLGEPLGSRSPSAHPERNAAVECSGGSLEPGLERPRARPRLTSSIEEALGDGSTPSQCGCPIVPLTMEDA
jgi:hypothetical protein